MASIYGHIQAISGKNTHNIELYYSLSSNISGNYTDVACDLYYFNSSSSSISTTARGSKGWISGEYFDLGNITLSGGGGYRVKVGSFSKRIHHNSDGTGSVDLWASVPIGATINGRYFASIDTPTKTIRLPKIPRASTISDTMVGSRVLATSHKITINRASTSFTHTLWYRLRGSAGTSSWYDLGSGHTTSVTFSPDDRSELEPNSSTVFMDICIATFQGDTQIGASTYSNGWYMTIPHKYVPKVRIESVEEVNARVKSAFGVFTKTLSSLRVKSQAIGSKGSSVKEVKVTVDKRSYIGSDIVTSSLSSSGTMPLKVEVTDSRGRKSSASKTIDVYDYNPVVNKSPTALRANAQGVADDEGSFAKISFDLSMTDTNSRNTLTYTIKYKVVDDKEFSTLTSVTGKSVKGSYLSPDVFNRDKSYIIQVEARDKFTTSVALVRVTATFSLLDFHKDGKGIAIGKVANASNLLDIKLPTLFRNEVEYKGAREFLAPLVNGWQHDYAYRPLTFVKDMSGYVHLDGVIKGGSLSYGSDIFRLPEGYRPSGVSYFYVFHDYRDIGGIRITADGAVQVGSFANKTFVGFDGIVFKGV